MRRTYQKLKFTHFTVELQYLLKIVVKRMNDIMNEIVLVSYRFVFETIPRFSILSTSFPARIKRMKAVRTAQAKMNITIAKRELFETLTRNKPPARTNLIMWEKMFSIIQILNKNGSDC